MGDAADNSASTVGFVLFRSLLLIFRSVRRPHSVASFASSAAVLCPASLSMDLLARCFFVDFRHAPATRAPVRNLLAALVRGLGAAGSGAISVCERSSAFVLAAVAVKLCGDSEDERFSAGSLRENRKHHAGEKWRATKKKRSKLGNSAN